MTQMTFLMGSDPTTGPAAANKFYKYAAQYFQRIGAPAYAWPAGTHSLEDVFTVLRKTCATSPAPDVINIVSHATGFGSLDFPLTALAAKPRIQLSDLADALNPAKSPLKPLALDGITGKASVILYGCDVGRNVKFVLMLGAMFSGPAKIVAPRRVATFFVDTTGAAQYRLSRSWSIPSKLLPAMPSPATSPLWPNFRTQFVQQAALIFGSKADRVRPLGSDDLRADLQNFVTKATDGSGDPSFFVEGYFGLTPEQVAPLAAANADPAPTGVPSNPQDVDDAWQATTLTQADAVVVSGIGSTTKSDVTVTVLTKVIDTVVDFADPTSFCVWYSSSPLAPGKPAPSIPANPPSGGATPPAPTGELGSLTDQLLAAGLAQTDLDPLLATLVQPTAGADDPIVAADADVPPADDPDDDDIDQPLPAEDV
jgi:hypothetical protein